MQHFNNYTIIKQIGEGGMATVYLATHNSLKHQVAIKVLNKEFVFNTNIRSRFIEEARKMVRMNHPNVVKVTDLIDDENSVAIVMEYVEGKTLKQILDEKKLTDIEIDLFLTQMVMALEYIHSQGLIHRDIKPSNFILSKDGYLKLSDFGISKSLDAENTQTGTSVNLGTPMYMSPEQVRSTKDVTNLTDIYSLGVVLWEMVSGKKPYDGNTLSIFDLQLKIVQEKLPLTNTKWDKLINNATQKEENSRFNSSNGFLIEINNVSDLNGFERVNYIEKSRIKPIKNDLKITKFKKLKYIILSTLLISFLLILIFIFFTSKRQHLENVPQLVKKTNIDDLNDKKLKEKIKLQNEIDSLKLITEQNFKDSLKLVAELKEKNKVKIGDYFQGGIVCKIDNLGKHGLVCSQSDLGRYNLDDAISICNNYSNDGYSDWYLPSEEELRIVYHKLCKRKVINFSGDRYWYKFENYNPTDDFSLNGFCDFQNWECELIDKRASLNVRAVRKF
jgi:serine/threonine protein kinase